MSSDNRFSEVQFLQFIDFVGKKGLVKESMAQNWRGAVTRLLSILEPVEKQDLRNLDVDELVNRYANLNASTITSPSLQIYKSRFKGAHKDFLSWAANPAGYKRSIGSNLSGERKAKAETNTAPKEKNSPPTTTHRIETQPTNDSVIFPIPITGGRIITINNLPHSLSKSDAEKICAVVKALAAES